SFTRCCAAFDMQLEDYYSLGRGWKFILHLIPFFYIQFILIILKATHDKKPLDAFRRNDSMELIRLDIFLHSILCTFIYLILQQPILFTLSLALDAHHLWRWFFTKFEDDDNIHNYFDWLLITYFFFIVFMICLCG
ncbi:hypothetical protein PFISCL1PPCAC_3244, partial [Pristionchus fissidentatus]